MLIKINTGVEHEDKVEDINSRNNNIMNDKINHKVPTGNLEVLLTGRKTETAYINLIVTQIKFSIMMTLTCVVYVCDSNEKIGSQGLRRVGALFPGTSPTVLDVCVILYTLIFV